MDTDQLKLENQKLVDCEADCKALEVVIRDKKSKLFQQRKNMMTIQEKISDLIKNEPVEEEPVQEEPVQEEPVQEEPV